MRQYIQATLLIVAVLMGFLFFILPFLTLGNVVWADESYVRITEIAWMGSDESPADEWIEIHNSNVDVIDIEGWKVLSDDGTPDFTINKEDCINTIIHPGGYLLLERTDDSSVPEVSADCIYTGALNNDGENIFIYNKEGVISDFINAADNWPAGDRESKNTMQWAGGDWVTATGTPKVAYLDTKVLDSEEERDDGDVILEGPICGDGVLHNDEECDDGNKLNGDGCTELCEFEMLGCEMVEESGWYGEYFNYSSEHPDMALSHLLWPDDGHGDPLSVVLPWDTNWYNNENLKFGRVDTALTFGSDFFPFDIAQEEIDIGGESNTEHEFYFGAHWRTILKGEPGSYEYKIASDDDAWVYVDGDLILDFSGIHSVNFATGTISVTGEHIIDIYFAERHTVKSHFSFEIEGDLVTTPFQDECLPKLSVCKYNDLKGLGPYEEAKQIQWDFAVTKTEKELDNEGNLILVSGINEDICTEYSLLPGSYNVYEKQNSNWSNTAVVKDGELVVASASTTAHAQDNLFDIYTQIDIGFVEQMSVDFYNFLPLYCGDGIVNQDWEQCDSTDDSCTSQCQFADDNMCRDLVLAKVTMNKLINVGAGDVASTTFVGSKFNALPEGTWFPIYSSGNFYIDPDISEYEDVPGLAIERQEGAIRIVLHGSNGETDREHVSGTISLYNATVSEVLSDSESGLGANNDLERPFDGIQLFGPGQDELDDDSIGKPEHSYWMTVNIADDGFITKWEIVEDCVGICGVKFEDMDLDQERDETDPGVGGWTIYLEKNEKMCLGEDFQNDEFELLRQCFGERTFIDSDCASADYDGNGAVGISDFSIFRARFGHALDEEGCYTDIRAIATTVTNKNGEYCFADNLESGEYVVTEEEKDGWGNTTPITQNVSFDGENRVDVLFGNARHGLIHGVKFFDLNQDGLRDVNEPTLPDWEIQLYKYPNAPWEEEPNNQPFATTSTMENGEYWFTDVPPGVYQVFEVNQDGWEQTAPALTTDGGLTVPAQEGGNVLPEYLVPPVGPVINDVTPTDAQQSKWLKTKLTENPTMLELLHTGLVCLFSSETCPLGPRDELKNLRYYSVLIESGTEIQNAHFGNFNEPGEIHGTKFHDINIDGLRDVNEPTLPDWEIQLYKYPNAPWEEMPNNQPFATTSTMENGEYWFTDVPPGVYQVFEVNQDGWEQTAPAADPVVLQEDILPIDADDVILNKNTTAHRLAICDDIPTECTDELHKTLMNLRYYSILIRSGEKIENADFGNQFTKLSDTLEIFGEENSEPGTTSVTVIWNTNLPATSRVVYGPDPMASVGVAPNYGYSTSTTIDTELVLNHSAEIIGLNPDTTYYWRAVSAVALEVIGNEKSFNTKKVNENNGDTENGGGTNGQGGTETGGGPQGGGGGGGGPPSLIGAYGIGGGGGIIPTTVTGSPSPFSPLTPVDTSFVVQAPADGGLVVSQSVGTPPVTSSGAEVGVEDEFPISELEREITDENGNDQVAGLAFLGITYECGIGVMILTLIILIAASIYIYSRHNSATHAIAGFIIGVVALWLIGSISCTFQLVVLAVMVLLLLGWEARTRKGQSL